MHIYCLNGLLYFTSQCGESKKGEVGKSVITRNQIFSNDAKKIVKSVQLLMMSFQKQRVAFLLPHRMNDTAAIIICKISKQSQYLLRTLVNPLFYLLHQSLYPWCIRPEFSIKQCKCIIQWPSNFLQQNQPVK